jgi:4-hydroxybenzoate polyprenyltransferase
MVFARNAAMAFNRYADRRFDGKNPRTANREIPAGKISPETALVFTAVNSILFCITTLFINRLTFGLSFAALAVILGYSYTKRFTALCHFILGLGLAIAPTGAYIAMTGAFSALPVLLSVLVLFWVGGFDILYALSDSVFDRKNRLRSIPAMLGNGNAMILSAVAHLSVAVTVIAIGLNFSRGILYWSGSFIFIFMMIYQQIIVWKKKDIGSYFGLINGISSICYGFFTILDLI